MATALFPVAHFYQHCLLLSVINVRPTASWLYGNRHILPSICGAIAIFNIIGHIWPMGGMSGGGGPSQRMIVYHKLAHFCSLFSRSDISDEGELSDIPQLLSLWRCLVSGTPCYPQWSRNMKLYSGNTVSQPWRLVEVFIQHITAYTRNTVNMTHCQVVSFSSKCCKAFICEEMKQLISLAELPFGV